MEKRNIDELLKQIQDLTKKEISLNDLSESLNISKYEVLGLIGELRNKGINITERNLDDDIYLFNQGEKEINEKEAFKFKTNDDGEFKFVAISDLRFGSKAQQMSILNDVYTKAYEMGYKNVIICGNLTEGIYPVKSPYSDSTFLDDTMRQVNYVIENYPKVEGITTYFITGEKDYTHFSKSKVNIGKRIADARDDMIYLGDSSCNVLIDKTKMNIFCSKFKKTYTVSYIPQTEIDSFRSEDKPDIFLRGGLLQMGKLSYRNVNCITVPSLCAVTEEMDDKKIPNTVGAWFITVKTDEKGKLSKITAIDSPYYVTNKKDYLNSKSLTINNGVIKTGATTQASNDELSFVNKIYKYIKDGMAIEDFMKKFNVNFDELQGLIELCRLNGKDVSIVEINKNLFLRKSLPKKIIASSSKPKPEELIHTQLCVVSDTHFGNNRQQLHLLNQIYEEAYKRGIDTVLHVGDLVDGNYPNRPENPRLQFLHGFDEQAGYVVDMYPKVDGLITKYILGSHDESHYKNGQSTVNYWISRCRDDMEYLGQDTATININGIKITMDHPGGGSSQFLSYKPQKRIELLEAGSKPKILLIGHYHKSYSFVYRNVRGIEAPALCDKTQFQTKQGLSNYLGAYFLDIYSDKNGNIQYFEPEEILFDSKDIWDEAGKDKKKVKQLIIR